MHLCSQNIYQSKPCQNLSTYIFSAVEDKVKTFDPRALNPSTNKQEETRSRGKTIEGSKTEKPLQFAKGILRQGRHRTPPRVEIHNIRSSLPEPEIEVLYTVYQGEYFYNNYVLFLRVCF